MFKWKYLHFFFKLLVVFHQQLPFIKNISYLAIAVIYDIAPYCVNHINGSYKKKHFYKFWTAERNGIKMILFMSNPWSKYMYRQENSMVPSCISLALWAILAKSHAGELPEINCCVEVIKYVLSKTLSCTYV